MIKRDELTDANSCMSRADDNEMTFVLLARDVAAPETIRHWIRERIRLGKNTDGDAQIVEAWKCAETMALHQCQQAASPAIGAYPTSEELAKRLRVAEGLLLALAELVGDLGTAQGSAGAQSRALFGHQTADDTRTLVHKIRAAYGK